MSKVMLMYYSTSLLWTRPLDIKAKRGNTNLTFTEQEFLKSMMIQDYNVPQPIYLFLKGIGEVKDPRGETIHLSNHSLPVDVAQGFGGYHSSVIDQDSHDLYEEIPSLGICGDIVMAEESEVAQVVPNFRVLSPRTRATKALAGYFGTIGDRKEEIRILLNSVGISAALFDETFGSTRLNIQLVQKVSDYLARSVNFKE